MYSEDKEVVRLRCFIKSKIAEMFYLFGDYEEAYRIYVPLLEIFETLGDSVSVAQTCLNIGSVLQHHRIKSDSCNTGCYASKGLCFVDENRHPLETAKLHEMLGKHELKSHRTRKRAIRNIQLSQTLVPENSETYYEISITLGRAFYYDSQYELAYENLMKSYRSPYPKMQNEAIRCLMLVSREMGKTEEAARFEEKYDSLEVLINKDIPRFLLNDITEQYVDYCKNAPVPEENRYKKLFVWCPVLLLIILSIIILLKMIRKRKSLEEKMNQFAKNEANLKKALETNVKQKKKFQKELLAQQQKEKSLQGQLEDLLKKKESLVQQLDAINNKVDSQKLQEKRTKLFLRQWEKLLNSDIYQTLMERCPQYRAYSAATAEMFSEPMTEVERNLLIHTINQLFNNFFVRFTEQYKNFNYSDINYCLFSLFPFDEVQKSAMMGMSYQGVRSCRSRIGRCFDIQNLEKDIRSLMINNMLDPENKNILKI